MSSTAVSVVLARDPIFDYDHHATAEIGRRKLVQWTGQSGKALFGHAKLAMPEIASNWHRLRPDDPDDWQSVVMPSWSP